MKNEKYQLLVEQVKALIEGERDVVAVMANVAAAIHEAMGFWWTGFYRVMPQTGPDDKELVLGPFQGPVACMHIPFRPSSCPMWSSSRVTSPVAASRAQRSWCLCFRKLMRWLPSSTSTAVTSPPSTTSIVSTLKPSAPSLLPCFNYPQRSTKKSPSETSLTGIFLSYLFLF